VHLLLTVNRNYFIESQRHHDFALLRRKFERVGKEVNQYLQHPPLVPKDLSEEHFFVYLYYFLELYAFLIGNVVQDHESLIYCLFKVKVLVVDSEGAGFELCEVEQVEH
jgi:hypothetical protein